MKKTFLLLMAVVVVISLYGVANAGNKKDAAAKKRVVVWRLAAKGGVTQKNIDSISGVLTSEVANSSGYKVIGEADITTFLKSEERKASCGMDTNCMLEIGNALGADEMVYGDLGKVGALWILNLVRMKASKAEVIKRTTRTIKGKIDDVVIAMPAIIGELYGKKIQKKTAEPVAKASATTKSEGSSAMRTASYWVFGSAAAVLAFGITANIVANKYASDYKDGDFSAYDKNGLWSNLAISGYSVGGALAATGLVLFFLGDDDSPKAAIAPQKNGLAISLQFRW